MLDLAQKSLPKTAKGSKNRCFRPPEKSQTSKSEQAGHDCTIQKQIPAIKFKQLQFP